MIEGNGTLSIYGTQNRLNAFLSQGLAMQCCIMH